MYCPKCGSGEQTPESYCRQCGQYLPDLDKPAKKKQSPSDHVKANTFLSLLTVLVSFTLAFLLYYFYLGRADTSPLIYVTAGFLLAIGFWNIQAFWRSILLRKHLRPHRSTELSTTEIKGKDSSDAGRLPEADFEDLGLSSVTDSTTRKLHILSKAKK